MEDITVQELKEKMDKGEEVVLVDVRELHEREEYNIGGEFIPLGELEEKIPQLESFRDKEIVMYCRSGRRSQVAQYMLLDNGFKKVRNLTGGILAWAEAFDQP